MFKKYIIRWHLDENDSPECVAQTRNAAFARHWATLRSKECGRALLITKPLFRRPSLMLFVDGEPAGCLID